MLCELFGSMPSSSASCVKDVFVSPSVRASERTRFSGLDTVALTISLKVMQFLCLLLNLFSYIQMILTQALNVAYTRKATETRVKEQFLWI